MEGKSVTGGLLGLEMSSVPRRVQSQQLYSDELLRRFYGPQYAAGLNDLSNLTQDFGPYRDPGEDRSWMQILHDAGLLSSTNRPQSY